MTTTVPAAPTGIVIPPLIPGSSEWLRKMSASKVAAALGLSTYESPFSLYHRMRGEIPPEPDNDQKRRGHYLEPAVAAWFADQHPTWTIAPGKCWQHRDHDWYTASPDRLIVADTDEVRLLECKTDDGPDWGAAGTDEVPPGYRAQVMSQLDVVGVQTAHVAVLLPYLEFREYVIEYDPAEAAFIRDRAAAFQRRVDTGDRPDIDSHAQTYQAVRALHPLINGEDVQVPIGTAVAFLTTRAQAEIAAAQAREAQAVLLDVMGDARRALVGTNVIARRQPARAGSIALYPVLKDPADITGTPDQGGTT